MTVISPDVNDRLEFNPMTIPLEIQENKPEHKPSPIIPVPEYAGPMDYRLDGQAPDIAYPYHDANGDLIGYIGRWNKPDGKDIRPITFCQTPNGEQKWASAGMPEPRPFYRLPEILGQSDKPVLICEGEKAAEAGVILFPDYVATTTMQGALAPRKTDFSPLKGRDVVIAMDYDEPGKKYGQAVMSLCRKAGVKSIRLLSSRMFEEYSIQDGRIVERQEELPKGYDLADAYAEGWTPGLFPQWEADGYGDLFIEPNVLFGGADSLADAPSDEWPEPQPIKAELLPVHPLPIEMIPSPLQAWVKDVAIRMQCPIDHIAIPSIIVIGSVIGSGCAIRPKCNDDWQVIPNLWGGIVGKPGTLKSPALSAVLHPLKGLVQKAMEDFNAKQKEYDCDRELHKCQKDSILSEARKGSKASSTSMDLQTTKQKLITLEAPQEPHCRRFEVNDPTIEKMGELLSQNPRGLLLFRDELIGLLAAWDKEGHEADRAFYLESWNGCGSYTTDRIGRGTVYCQNMCVSVLGGTQPSKLTGYLHRAIGGIENDGLIQRFQMLIYPDEIGNWKLTDQKPDSIAQKRAYGIVEKLADMDFCLHGAAKQNEKDMPYFHFGDAAQEMFYEWLTDLQAKLDNTEDPDIIIEHLSKYRKLMPALALIFHLIDMADGKTTGPVTLESAEKAAAWCGYLESHARRIYNLGLNKRVQGAKALSKKLKKKEVNNPFSARDVYRKEWSYLSKVEDVQNACEELIELGWLREETISPSKGQKGKTQYHINPKVWGDDA